MRKKPENKVGLTYYTDAEGDWRWKIVAKSGRVVGASTEGYRRLTDCEKNVSLLLNFDGKVYYPAGTPNR